MSDEVEPGALLTAIAGATKTLADAEKVRAETDKLRAEREEIELLRQNKLEVAGVDLETKRLANQKASQENEAARIDKLISQVTGVLPDIASVGKSTVTFAEGSALRQGEAALLATKAVAGAIAAHIRAVFESSAPGAGPIYLSSNTSILTAVAGYRQISAEAEVLMTTLNSARSDANKILEQIPAPPYRRFVEKEAGFALAAFAGAAVQQVASLFELEVAVTTNTSDIAALSMHAAVAGKISEGGFSRELRHESARVPPGDSILLTTIKELVSVDIDLADLALKLDQWIEALGEPVTELAALQEALKAAKSDEERDAEIAEAGERIEKLKQAKDARTRLTAVVEKAAAFAARIVKVSDTKGVSPLEQALAVEAMASSTNGDTPLILIIPAAVAETSQLVIKRRIFAPRFQTSTSVQVMYFLVQGENIYASGLASKSISFRGKITRFAAKWSKAKPLDQLN